MNVEKEIKINKEDARIFARAIYRDISTYIQSHPDEYNNFIKEDFENENKNSFRSKKLSNKTQKRNGGDKKTIAK